MGGFLAFIAENGVSEQVEGGENQIDSGCLEVALRSN